MTTIYRATCAECGADFRRPTMPLVAFASCPLAACVGDLTWQRWEAATTVEIRVGTSTYSEATGREVAAVFEVPVRRVRVTRMRRVT